MENIEKRVFDIYKMNFNQLSNDMTDIELECLGFDSIMFIDIVDTIEKEFNITLKDEHILMRNFNTVKKTVNIIMQYV